MTDFIRPAVETNHPASVLGMPLFLPDGDQVLGDQGAYFVTIDERALWHKPNVESMQALWLRWVSGEDGDHVLHQLHGLPELRALVIDDGPVVLDPQPLLASVPQLQVLWLNGDVALGADVSRHANLEQLAVHGPFPICLTACSFPKLSFLEVGIEDTSGLNTVLANGAFPLLRHLGLVVTEDNAINLKDVKVPDSIDSINLIFDGHLHSTTMMQAISQLAQLPIAKILKRLTLSANAFVTADVLTRAYFPQLIYLRLSFYAIYENERPMTDGLAQLRFDDRLHVDLSRCSLNAQQALKILRWTEQYTRPASLNLRYNDIGAKNTLRQLANAPFPVGLDEQVA